MKLFVGLTLIIFAVTRLEASLQFEKDKEYEYEYYAHHLSTIDKVGNRRTGLAIKSNVLIKVKEDDKLYFSFRDFKTAKLNEDLEYVDEEELKRSLSFETVKGKLNVFLHETIEVTMKRGKVESLKVSFEEPNESLNVKKAVLGLLQLDTDCVLPVTPYASIPSRFRGYSDNQLSSRIRQNPNDTQVTKCMESWVDGECASFYIMESNPSPEAPDSDVLNITKMRDYSECDSSPPLWIRSTHAPIMPADCEADDMELLKTVTQIQYDIKRRGQKLFIERIEAEAKTLFTPYTEKSDYFSANHSQILTLIEVRPITDLRTAFAAIKLRTKILPALHYIFPTANRFQESGKPESVKNNMVPFFYDERLDVVPPSIKLMQEIVHDIILHQNVDNIPLKCYKLAANIRFMDKDQIDQFYRQACVNVATDPSIKPEDVKKICIDMLLISGNHPSIVKIKYLIESKQIPVEMAVQAVHAMATNIFEPTYLIVDEILKMAKSPVAHDYPRLRYAIFHAVAILIGKACNGRYENNKLPTVPAAPHLKEYCSNEIEDKYIQGFNNELESNSSGCHIKNVIRTLGLTELPSAIPGIRPYAEGDADDDGIQVIALLSLIPIAKFAPDEVMEIVEPEFYDTNNTNYVRLAAFKAMMASQPTFSDLQRVAAWATNEPSDDVSNFIYNFFDEMSNATHYGLKNFANDAEQVMSYLDEDDASSFLASNYIQTSEILEDAGVSTMSYCAWTADDSPPFPRSLTCGTNLTIGGFSIKPVKFTLHMKGLNSVLNRLVGPDSVFTNIKTKEDVFRPPWEIEDKQRTNINEKLKLKTMRDEPFEIDGFLKIGDTQVRSFYLDHNSILGHLQSSGISPRDLEKGISIAYYQISLLCEVQMQTSSILGIPMLCELKMPSVVSVQGMIQFKWSNAKPEPMALFPRNVEISVDVTPKFSTATKISLGCYSPFNEEVLLAEVRTSSFAAPSINVEANINILHGRISAVIKPSVPPHTRSDSNENGLLKVAHHRVKPSSAICPVDKPEELCSQHSKVIRIRKPNIREVNLRKKLLGIPAILKISSEHDWDDSGSFRDWIDEYDSLVTLLNTWFITPEFAARSYDIYLQGDTAQDNEFELALDWKYIPTPVERKIFKSKTTAQGLWPVFSGFANLPQGCNVKVAGVHTYSEEQPWYLQIGSIIHDKFEKLKDTYGHKHSFYEKADHYSEVLTPFFSKSREGRDSASPWEYDESEDNDAKAFAGPHSFSPKQEGEILVEIVNRSNEVSTLIFNIRAAAKGLASKMETGIILMSNEDTLTKGLSVTINATNIPGFSAPNVQICSRASLKFPERPCDYHSLMTTDLSRTITGDLTINWGPGRCLPSNYISGKAIFMKSEEQVREEEAKTQWYFTQCQYDISTGQKLSYACERVLREFSSLNKMVAEFKYSKFSNWMKNLTSMADNYLKAKYYPQMSNNPTVQNGEGHMKMISVIRDEVQSLDLKFFKPTENTFFKKIYLGDTYPILYPISVSESPLDEFYDDITGCSATPTCQVMGKHVITFDNTTYKYKMPAGCKHVVAKDCSPEDQFAVTVASIGSGLKSVEISLLSHKFTITPKERYTGEFKVTVDGRKLEIHDDRVLVLKSTDKDVEGEVIALIVTTGPSFHLLAPTHGMKVETDSEDVEITISGLWANRVCGLCGHFDGESGADDLIGPQQCLYPDPVSFAMSYILPDSQCSPPPPPNVNKNCYTEVWPQPRKSFNKGDYDGDYSGKYEEDQRSSFYMDHQRQRAPTYWSASP